MGRAWIPKSTRQQKSQNSLFRPRNGVCQVFPTTQQRADRFLFLVWNANRRQQPGSIQRR